MASKLEPTARSVRARVKLIGDLADDYEHAHQLEDELFGFVLRVIADEGHPLAKAAIKSRSIKFPRYTA